MNKILTIEQAVKRSKQLKARGKKLVLSGGAFDIVHQGHVQFLKRSKDLGDVLFVLLESDESIRKLKGGKRPYNTQKNRAKILSTLHYVDYIVPLAPFTDADYDKLVLQLKPAIISTTTGDLNRFHKDRQAKKVHARVVEVIERIPHLSTTKYGKTL